MAKEKVKGSIIYEILILVLAVALIATIMYPKSVWEKAERDMLQCRKNMDKILKAELIYLKYHNSYQDTLEKVVSFIQNDPTKRVAMEYVYADTALAKQILDDLTASMTQADLKIKTFLADTMLKTIIQTTQFDSNLAKVSLNRLENTKWRNEVQEARKTDSSQVYVFEQIAQKLPVLDIITPLEIDDSLSIVLQRIGPEISIGSLVDTLYQNPEWNAIITKKIDENFKDFRYCPTNGEPYRLVVIDTSVIKYLNINCPIDAKDFQKVKKNFILYHFGHLRLENHGGIEGGEKTWLKQ